MDGADFDLYPGEIARRRRRQRRRQVDADQGACRARSSPTPAPSSRRRTGHVQRSRSQPGARHRDASTRTSPWPRRSTWPPTSSSGASCAHPGLRGRVFRCSTPGPCAARRACTSMRWASRIPDVRQAGGEPLGRPAPGLSVARGAAFGTQRRDHGRAHRRPGRARVGHGARPHPPHPGPRHSRHPHQPRHAPRLRVGRPHPHPPARPARRVAAAR